ncbi:MAG: TIGR04282 family arsenosugar biosynthesis glycosyltransferase [Magnetococcales bacterium]|nr:TIGR04282 family arsenosugar biosynthesis glycosyltransferase [Magnetococcales bacterium]
MWAIVRLLLISLNILGRTPIAGQVKTRLIPALGANGAAIAHEQLLSHVVGVAKAWCEGVANRELKLWCTPDIIHPYFNVLLPGEQRYKQPQGDLGQRMSAIVSQGLQTADGVVLLGGDGVSVSETLLNQVEAALAQVPVVIASAEDGGYILIAMSTHVPSLFTNMPWGTDKIAQETRLRLNSQNIQWQDFSGQWDVDNAHDWERFKRTFQPK